jgi:hypothetical protein
VLIRSAFVILKVSKKKGIPNNARLQHTAIAEVSLFNGG